MVKGFERVGREFAVKRCYNYSATTLHNAETDTSTALAAIIAVNAATWFVFVLRLSTCQHFHGQVLQ